MHEVDLRFIKTIDDSGAGEKIHGSEVIAAPNFTGVPKEQRDELFARHDRTLNTLKHKRYQSEAENKIHEILRRSHSSSPTPKTFEEQEIEADKLDPYRLKSKKEDAGIIIADCDEALTYLADYDSEQNRAKIENGDSYFFVKCSAYRTQPIYVRRSQWDKHAEETKDTRIIITAYRDLQKAVSTMQDSKIKERENPKAVSEIINEANNLVKEHKHLTQKVKQAALKPIDELSFQTAKVLVEGMERLRVIEGELNSQGQIRHVKRSFRG